MLSWLFSSSPVFLQLQNQRCNKKKTILTSRLWILYATKNLVKKVTFVNKRSFNAVSLGPLRIKREAQTKSANESSLRKKGERKENNRGLKQKKWRTLWRLTQSERPLRHPRHASPLFLVSMSFVPLICYWCRKKTRIEWFGLVQSLALKEDRENCQGSFVWTWILFSLVPFSLFQPFFTG